MTIRRVVVDHVDLLVRDLEASRTFYQAALEPLGYTILAESGKNISFGVKGADDFGIHQSEHPTVNAHVAFVSPSQEAVDTFYAKALGGGGRSKVAPQLHPEYHANYYAAYVFDPDGNNIEAVYHGAGASGEKQTAGDEVYERSQSALTLQQLQESWGSVKKRLRDRNKTGPRTAAYLNDFTIVAVEQGSNATIVVLQAAHMLHYQYLNENSTYCADVEWALQREFGVPCRVLPLAPG
jgi:catechol-2,3-dioxygenase